MLKFYCQLLGEDYAILKQHSLQSKRKVIAMGTAIMLPIIIWFITAFLFGHTFFHASPLLSFLSAIMFSLIIFIIERTIILSNGSKGLQYFRISLGFIVALLGAICMDEVLFADDINQQKRAELHSSYLTDIPMEVGQLTEEIQRLDVQLEQKNLAIQKEAQGNGSGFVGVGAITKLLIDQADQIKQEKELKEIALAGIKTQNESEYLNNIERIESGETDTQLLMNIKALFQIVKSDGWVAFIFFMVFILFTLLEFLVIILKVTFKKSSYDVYVETSDKIERIKQQRRLRRIEQHFDPLREDAEFQDLKARLHKIRKGSMAAMF